MSKLQYGIVVVLLAGLVVMGFLPAKVQPLGAEGDTNLTNLVLSGTLTSAGITDTGTVSLSGAVAIGSAGSLAVGGGYALDYDYATTVPWDSGLVAVTATSTSNFTLSPAGASSVLPAVGDSCTVGNQSASSTQLENYIFKVTAANASTASGTLIYQNLGPAIDYGVATLNVLCWNL